MICLCVWNVVFAIFMLEINVIDPDDSNEDMDFDFEAVQRYFK